MSAQLPGWMAGLICKALKILCGFCFTFSGWMSTGSATEFRCDVPNKLFSNSKHLLSARWDVELNTGS